MTPSPTDIWSALSKLVTNPSQAVDVSGERFGFLVPRIPVGRDRQGIVWLCDCERCGGSRNVSVGRLRGAVRMAKQRGKECTLSCLNCKEERRGRPAVEQEFVARPRVSGPPVRSSKRPPSQSPRLSRRKRTQEPTKQGDAEVEVELVVDGRVLARGKASDDWSRWKPFGGTLRPIGGSDA